ncbi:hypothetical protein [Ferrimonas futtsuensis]|uniref:hypothetical protein n=1 Tax=Ferrimonas futtsuensis TaxID=364764 RepID=UPI0003FE8DA8|nr:hypothetical protein [Ferrimonas futtsuensis]
MRPMMITALILPLLAAPQVQAKPHHGPQHKAKVIVVKPGAHHKPHHNHYAYHHKELTRIATFAVYSGVTYAIVDDAYYRKHGDHYLYVESPPAGHYSVIQAGDAGSGYTLGQRLGQLPSGSHSVVVDGISYHNLGEHWFVPLAGGQSYVVVESPLE